MAVIRDPDNKNELAKDSEKHPEERHEENKAKMESRKPREWSYFRRKKGLFVSNLQILYWSQASSLCAFLQEILVPKKEVQRNRGLDFSLCGEECRGHVD